MKHITVELNTKSIKEAQKYLLNLKKQIPKMQQEFLMAVAKWIVKKADEYIDRSDIGSLIKSKIKECLMQFQGGELTKKQLRKDIHQFKSEFRDLIFNKDLLLRVFADIFLSFEYTERK